MTPVTIRPAEGQDFAAVCTLLSAAKLPTDGLQEQFGPAYAVALDGAAVVGAEGIERYGAVGLLRSAVVHPDWRGRGIGDDLTRDRLAWAKREGLAEVWLLTTTAADYFPRFGFEVVNRADAPAALQASIEFKEACPASAVAMRLRMPTEAE